MTSFKQNSTGVIYLSIRKKQYAKIEDIWIKNNFFDIDLCTNKSNFLFTNYMYVYAYKDLYLYIYWTYTEHILCT